MRFRLLVRFTLLFGLILLLSSCNNIDIPFLSDDEPTKIVQNDEPSKTDHQKTEDNKPNGEQAKEDSRPTLAGTTKKVDGKVIVTNVDDILVLVNKERNLPSDYIPKNLVVPDVPFPYDEDVPKKQMQKVAADAVEKLFAAAEKAGLHLYAQSGYRSYARQAAIFAYNVKTQGEEEASKVSAHPGQSEHQTGLSLDVTSPVVKFDLLESFGETEEGIWLKENAAKFGFIIRYPKEKVAVTGYTYEPWHIRYVGKDVATEIMNNGITLEEYFRK